MPNTAPIKPVYFGLCPGSTRSAIIAYEPEKSPAAPVPQSARPTIKAVELGASPVRALLAMPRTGRCEVQSGPTAEQTADFEEHNSPEIHRFE